MDSRLWSDATAPNWAPAAGRRGSAKDVSCGAWLRDTSGAPDAGVADPTPAGDSNLLPRVSSDVPAASRRRLSGPPRSPARSALPSTPRPCGTIPVEGPRTAGSTACGGGPCHRGPSSLAVGVRQEGVA